MKAKLIKQNGIGIQTIDGIVGDEKYQQLIKITPENKLPELVNIGLNKDKDECNKCKKDSL
jgi:hypothetical protein